MSDAILGVIVGGIIGIAGALLTERYRAGREDRFRHVVEKRQAYATFAREAESFADGANRRLRALARGDRPGPPEDMATFGTAYETVEILAPEGVVAEARILYVAAIVLRMYGWGISGQTDEYVYDDPEGKGWRSDVEGYQGARRRFLEAARVDLGVDPSDWLTRVRRARPR